MGLRSGWEVDGRKTYPYPYLHVSGGFGAAVVVVAVVVVAVVVVAAVVVV